MTKKNVTYFSAVFLSVLLLLFFPSVSENLNSNIIKSFKSISIEEKPDTNIILIEIDEIDIANLGGWPLKRSYYALIIENLVNLKAKKIGLEVFLSEKVSSQNVYNSVLEATVKENKNVILASLLENVKDQDTAFHSENILYPQPKIQNPEILTGHINFIEDRGIIIPIRAYSDHVLENSFGYSLASENCKNSTLKLNVLHSWDLFPKYSIIQFFRLLEDNDKSLRRFKDKIVLIGITDPLIAKSLSTDFNEYLPGLAIHAFAVDNILNNRGINTNYVIISTYLFFLFVLITVFIRNEIKFIIFYFAVFVIFAFLIWNSFYIEIDYSAFVIPMIAGIGVNLVLNFLENKELLKQSKEESESLKLTLSKKEDHLVNLKSELRKQANNPPDALVFKIKNLEDEIAELKKDETEDIEKYSRSNEVKNFEGIVYKSKQMDGIINLVKKVSPENASVLISGESGSGKELIAKAIHNLSDRRNSKFVAVNCAALPDNLLESELFGHVKGAFTDAVQDKIGRFEEADNGTLFLDEIGETSDNFQAKLLRILQSGEFQKVGSSNTQKVDVRIVAATNKNLNKLISSNKFREDLYYRLNVINIELPSLSERKDDIPVLADYFVKIGDPEFAISKAVMRKLSENEWKGNVRELESVIKRGVIFAKSEDRKLLKLKDLPESLSKISKDDLESMILQSLREKKFSHSAISETAEELGGMGRTVISENFRGIFFKTYSENNYKLDKTVEIISASEEHDVKNKVKSKFETYLLNLEKDLTSLKSVPFDEIKNSFSSKYKNLPQKYHLYLDMVIKKLLEDIPE